MINEPFNLTLEWEGPEALDLVELLLQGPRSNQDGLNALYLMNRKSTMKETLGALAALDQFTADAFKGSAYYALIGVIFLASTRPFEVIHIPKEFESLAEAISEDASSYRRTVREKDLVGILANRVQLKEALAFLCDKKLLEPIGVGEFYIPRRPIRKLKTIL